MELAAICTHYLFAQELLPALPVLLPEIQISQPAVLWGTQGPDIFFFHRALPTMLGKSFRAAGSRLHRTPPSLIFDAMQEYLDIYKQEKDVLSSYIVGFLMHYALDRNIHPFVFAQQRDYVEQNRISYNPSIIHNQIETNLDILALKTKLGIKGNEFNPAETLELDEEIISVFAGLYSYVLNRVLGQQLSAEALKMPFYDTVRVQKALCDRGGRKRGFVSCLEKIVPFAPPGLSTLIRTPEVADDWDYANASKRPWTDLSQGKESRLSFFEIYQNALEDAKELIIGFFHPQGAMTMEELTKEITFDAGEKTL